MPNPLDSLNTTNPLDSLNSVAKNDAISKKNVESIYNKATDPTSYANNKVSGLDSFTQTMQNPESVNKYLKAQAQAINLGRLDFTGSVQKVINNITSGASSKLWGSNDEINNYYKDQLDQYEYNSQSQPGLGVGRLLGNAIITSTLNPAVKAAAALPDAIGAGAGGGIAGKLAEYTSATGLGAATGGALAGLAMNPESQSGFDPKQAKSGAILGGVIGPVAQVFTPNYLNATENLNKATKEGYGAIVYNADVNQNPIKKYWKAFFDPLFGMNNVDRTAQDKSLVDGWRNMTQAITGKNVMNKGNMYGEDSAERVATDIRSMRYQLTKEDSKNWDAVLKDIKDTGTTIPLNSAMDAANISLGLGKTGIKDVDDLISSLSNTESLPIDELHKAQSKLGKNLSGLGAKAATGNLSQDSWQAVKDIREALISDMGDSLKNTGNERLYLNFLRAQENTKGMHSFIEAAPSDINKVINNTMSGMDFINGILSDGSQKGFSQLKPYLGDAQDTAENLKAAVLMRALKNSITGKGTGTLSIGKFLGEIQDSGPLGSVMGETYNAVQGLQKIAQNLYDAKIAANQPKTIYQKTMNNLNSYGGAVGLAGAAGYAAGGIPGALAAAGGVKAGIGALGWIAKNSPMKKLLARINDTETGSDAFKALSNQFQKRALQYGVILQSTPDGSIAINQQEKN